MTVRGQAQSVSLAEGKTVEARPRLAWRREYTLLIAVALLMTAVTVAFFYLGTDVSRLRAWGYAGLFLINLVGAASIFLPTPAGASVLGGGAFLNDFLGIPAFLWVGLVAGLAEALGEFSGYAAGYGGRPIVQDHPEYQRVRGWMERRGVIAMFLMSAIPNPFFDAAGLAAGAVQMPLTRFFLSVLAGKVVKDACLAGFGGLGVFIFGSFLS